MALLGWLKSFAKRILIKCSPFVLSDVIPHLERIQATQSRLLAQMDEAQASLRVFSETQDESQRMLSAQMDEAQASLCALRETQDESQRLLAARLDRYDSMLSFVNPELTLLSNESHKRQKVLIVGFYGAPNLGDEMMLETLLLYLRRSDQVEITVMLAENPDFDATIYGDVRIIHYSRTVSDFSHLSAHFDVLILGGGAVLDDEAWMQPGSLFLPLARIVIDLSRHFIARKKAVFAVGLSTNKTLSRVEFINLLSEVIAGSTYFSLRDESSIETLRKVNAKVGRVCKINDIALAHPLWKGFVADSRTANSYELAITWVNLLELESPLVQVIDELTSLSSGLDRPLRITLVPFYMYRQADRLFYERVLGQLSQGAAAITEVTCYPANLESAVRLFASKHAAINIRYHAAVVCGMLGTPQIMLELTEHPHYPNKMKWVEQTFPSVASLQPMSFDPKQLALQVLDLFSIKEVGQIDSRIANDSERQLDQVTQSILNTQSFE